MRGEVTRMKKYEGEGRLSGNEEKGERKTGKDGGDKKEER